MWFIGVEVGLETSAPPPKKNPGSAPVGNVVDKKKKPLKTTRTCVYEQRKINFFPKCKSIVFVKKLRFIQRSFLCKTDQEKRFSVTRCNPL